MAMGAKVNRRTFLKAAGGAVAAGLLPGAVRAQARPVRIGFSLAFTGPNAVGASITQASNYALWIEQVNARGGLLVAGEGRRPIQYLQNDDRSEMETTVRLYEKLITEDKVDLLLPPWGTAWNFAVAPIASKHGYPLIGSTVQSTKLNDLKLPYFYAILAQADAMMGSLTAFLQEVRREKKFNKVAVIHVADLFGLEQQGVLLPLLKEAAFDIVEVKSYPYGVKDLSDTLKSIKAKGAEIFIGLTYPPDTILATSQAKALDFNPPVFYTAVGTAFPFFRERLKASTEGVLGMGAWNPKVPYPGAKAYFDAHVASQKKEPDRFASAFGWAALQILEEAVGKVGLDRAKIKAYLDSTEFTTVVGPVKFVQGLNRATPGMVGQWQKGEFEVVWPRERATATAIVPKPNWQ